MTRPTIVLRYGLVTVALLLTGYNGIVEGINATRYADTPGMKAATLTQLVYGFCAAAAIGAMFLRRAAVGRILLVWALAVTATGTLAPVVYAGQSILMGAAVGATTGAIAALLVWAWPRSPAQRSSAAG